MNYQINGGHIHYINEGSGSPVILVHGIAASLCDWTDLIPELVTRGFSAYALDLLGHGESIKPDDPQAYNIESIFSYFRDWLAGLHLNEPPLLVGHSLGGYLSLLYTLQNLEKVRGLILVDPLYSPNQLSSFLRVVRRRPALGEKVMRIVSAKLILTLMGWDPITTNQLSPSARHQIALDYKRASPHFVYITKDIPDLTPELPRITLPALVVWGEKDQTLVPNSFSHLTQSLPNATSREIPNCGHQPHIGKPEIFNRYTLAFLNNLATVNAGSI